MRWPFVTRARFDDLEARHAELQQELRCMREVHERVLDEINFRSTGFHLYPRFEAKSETPEPVRRKPEATEGTASEPAEDAGGRLRTQLRVIEQRNLAKYEGERKLAQELAQASKQRAAEKLEETLREVDTTAAG